MSWIKASILVVGLVSCGQAQLQSLEIPVSGLDCASCAGGIEKRLKRVRGVESASLEMTTSIVRIVFAPENSVKLDLIRDALKGLGYTPGDAAVVVIGTVTGNGVDLPHQPEAFILDKANGSNRRVRITGRIKAGTKNLSVQSIAPE